MAFSAFEQGMGWTKWHLNKRTEGCRVSLWEVVIFMGTKTRTDPKISGPTDDAGTGQEEQYRQFGFILAQRHWPLCEEEVRPISWQLFHYLVIPFLHSGQLFSHSLLCFALCSNEILQLHQLVVVHGLDGRFVKAVVLLTVRVALHRVERIPQTEPTILGLVQQLFCFLRLEVEVTTFQDRESSKEILLFQPVKVRPA